MSKRDEKSEAGDSNVVSTAEAAKILNVSTRYVEQLIDDDRLPLHYAAGRERFLRNDDVLAYKATAKAVAQEALVQLMEASERAGLYVKEAREALKPFVPADFPREPLNALLSGSHPKLALRMIDGRAYAGLTPDELYERYDTCEDLARQLANYCTRKADENPEWTHEFNIERTERGVTKKRAEGKWDISEAEQAWVIKKMREFLNW